jgi:hypothetical protein
MIVDAKFTEDGRPEFDAADFKEMEARARGPEVLADFEIAIVSEAKAEGNVHFRAGQITAALQAYQKALEVFADRKGDLDQRKDKSKLLANRAECLLRLEHWESAEKSASYALELNAENEKARFRRARACLERGGEEQLDRALADLEHLKLASNGKLGRAERELLHKVATEREALRKAFKQGAGGLRAAFASGGARLAAEGADAASSQDSPASVFPTTRESAWMCRLQDDVNLRHAYLIDTYRTRVDDDRTSKARDPHGIGDPNCSAASVLVDFLVFCRLAVARGVAPSAPAALAQPGLWDWSELLSPGCAATMLCKMFNPDVCQPHHRYGKEMGVGPPFRARAALVYEGTHGADEPAPPGPSAEVMRRETMESCWRDGGVAEEEEDEDEGLVRSRRQVHMVTFDRNAPMFADVGGVGAWRVLLAALGQGIR